jgi:hypothetical protein
MSWHKDKHAWLAQWKIADHCAWLSCPSVGATVSILAHSLAWRLDGGCRWMSGAAQLQQFGQPMKNDLRSSRHAAVGCYILSARLRHAPAVSLSSLRVRVIVEFILLVLICCHGIIQGGRAWCLHPRRCGMRDGAPDKANFRVH